MPFPEVLLFSPRTPAEKPPAVVETITPRSALAELNVETLFPVITSEDEEDKTKAKLNINYE